MLAAFNVFTGALDGFVCVGIHSGRKGNGHVRTLGGRVVVA